MWFRKVIQFLWKKKHFKVSDSIVISMLCNVYSSEPLSTLFTFKSKLIFLLNRYWFYISGVNEEKKGDYWNNICKIYWRRIWYTHKNFYEYTTANKCDIGIFDYHKINYLGNCKLPTMKSPGCKYLHGERKLKSLSVYNIFHNWNITLGRVESSNIIPFLIYFLSLTNFGFDYESNNFSYYSFD